MFVREKKTKKKDLSLFFLSIIINQYIVFDCFNFQEWFFVFLRWIVHSPIE